MIQYKIIDRDDYQYVEATHPDGKVWAIPMDESNSDYQRYLAWLNGEAKGDLIS